MAQDTVSIREFIAKEAELQELRRMYGSEAKPTALEKIIDSVMRLMPEPTRVSRKKYVLLALLLGWICGAHRWYAGHRIQAALYLLFSWTGASLALTVVDILLVYLKTPADEEGMVVL